MAQTFLETDFLLRRATPTPSRVPTPAPSRTPFVVRDPDASRAPAPTRSQEARPQSARAESARRDLAGRPDRAPTESPGMDRSERPDRSWGEASKVESSKAERQPERLQPTRDAPVPGGKATASANPGASEEAGAEAKAGPRDPAGAVTAPAAGAVGSPEAAVAGTVLAGANPTGKTASSEAGAADGAEEETDPAEVSEETAAPSLLDFSVPPPPSADPVPAAGPGHGGGASSAQGQAALGNGPASTGQLPAQAGSVQPSEGHGPAGVPEAGRHPAVPVTGQPNPVAAGGSEAGKLDPAVAVHEPTGTSGAAAALALPDGLSPVRESFDSVLAGLSTSSPPATAPAASAAAPQATQTPAPAMPSVPLGAVPMTIGLRSLQGSNHFEIRLDPGELGRIDVSLDIDKERGTVMAHLVVDRIETLALLQRDAGSLQQALSQAGLDAQEANINLSLRSDTQAGGQGAENRGSDGRRSEGRSGGPGLSQQPETRAALDAIPVRTLRGLAGLDIRI